jgi:hypothetical protein
MTDTEILTADDTEALHRQQHALWGRHDTPRKSTDETDSPCKCNRTGLCDRLECCLRWSEPRP